MRRTHFLEGLRLHTSLVKRVQSGSLAITGASGTATISKVNRRNTFVTMSLWNQGYDAGSLTLSDDAIRLELTADTTLTGTRGTAANASSCRYEVIEFVVGVLKRIQRITVSAAGVTGTTTISAVNTGKVWLNRTGFTLSAGSTFGFPTSQMASATSVEGNALSAITVVHGFEVMEFY
jgi:hypothetical protein